MSTLLKDLYSAPFYDRLAKSLSAAVPGFSKTQFRKLVFSKDFEDMELKQRMKHTTAALHHFMPEKFSETALLLEKIITQMRADGFPDDRLEYMFFPDYIETYGMDDYKSAVKAFVFVTQFVSCEFAVRPFIVQYGSKMLAQMEQWSRHKNAKVRRLASEGSRPRLPWAMALPALKKDPSPILPILENLKNDTSESVRRSVANSLNDIAKDHPDIVIEIAAKWKGVTKETDAVIKHGSRTLLKQGHTAILQHYGLESRHVHVEHLEVHTPKVKTGGSLAFSFQLHNSQEQPVTIRLEYAIYYRRANNSYSKKVFKISEKTYAAHEKVRVQRKQSFKLITTRKFYAGEQQLAIIVNGEEKTLAVFELAD